MVRTTPLRIIRISEGKATNRYEIVHSDVDEKPEGAAKLLKRMVGERGFEPPTPWSRTRFQSLLKSVEFC